MRRRLLSVFCLIASAALSVGAQGLTDAPNRELHDRYSGDQPLISYALRHQQELNFTPSQVSALERLASDFKKEFVRKTADIQSSEIELNDLLRGAPLDRAKAQETIKRIEVLRSELRMIGIDVEEKVRSLLDAKQLKKLDSMYKMSSPVESPTSQPSADLRQQIQSVLNDQYKDQHFLEIETAEAVATRVFDWAKWVGIILGLVGVVLGALGIKTYSDFKAMVRSRRVEIEQMLATTQQQLATTQQHIEQASQEASQQIEAIRVRGDNLSGEYQKLEARLVEYQALDQKVGDLASKVQRIEEQIGFVPSAALTPERQKEFTSALEGYREYLRGLGYQPKGGRIEIHVAKSSKSQGTMAYYDTENRRMVIASDYADKPTIIFREYNHHVLYSKIDLNSISSHDSYWAYYSIESGLASYFSCSYTNDPDAVGWNLENERNLSELKHNVSSAMADGTAIWGGAFWDLRKLVGKVVDKLCSLLGLICSRLTLRLTFIRGSSRNFSTTPQSMMGVLT